MARQLVGIGSSANDGTGDTLRDGIDKVNDNFIEIYGKIGDGTTIGTFTTTVITSTGDFTINSSADIILDADGGDIFFKDGITVFGSATNTSGNLIIKSGTTTNLTMSGANMTSSGVITATGFTIGSAAITETELEILDGASVTTTELNLLDGGTSVGSSITLADADGIIVNDGGTMKTVPASAVKTYAGGNPAADDISAGDAAVTLSTTSGNITIDATANNTDIIFKGTDATADITMLTLDGSEAGAASFNSIVTATGFTIGSAAITEAELETIDGVTAGTVAASKAVVVDSNKDIGTFRNLTIDGVFTDGNYTFDTSGNVSGLGTIGSGAITSTGVVTATGFTIGSAVITEAELEILDGANVTTTELNIIDGGTSATSTTLVDADRFVVNDNGTMVQVAGSDLKTYIGGNAKSNMIINGDMLIAQRGTSFTSGSNDDDSYTLDRWIVLSDTNDVVDVTRTSGSPDGGSKYGMQLEVETVNKKFGVCQIVESVNCHHVVGDTASFSFKAKVSDTSKLDNIKVGVVAWSGTADSVTSDIVSAWGSEGTNPTLASNLTYENTPANLSLTTSWVEYKIENISIDTSSTVNLIVFIWSDVTDTTLTHKLYVTDIQLEKGSKATAFERKPQSQSLSDCQRYYFKPSGNSVGTTYSTIGLVFNVCFPMVMRSSPSATIEYSGTANRLYKVTSGATQDITLNYFGNASQTTHLYDGAIGSWAGSLGDAWNTQFTYNSEL